MPSKDKVEVTLEIESDQLDWLMNMATKFDLSDESKAARVLLDYAIRDAADELIFAAENMRCVHCE